MFIKYYDSTEYLVSNYTNMNKSRVRVVERSPSGGTHIKNSVDWNLMYELAGGFTDQCFNYADPTKRRERCVYSRNRVVQLQGKPENRKLPYSRLSICKTIHAGRVG